MIVQHSSPSVLPLSSSHDPYQRRTQLGLLRVSSEGGTGTIQQFQSSDLLPQAIEIIKKYELWAV